jgi:protein involved in polysaccharide export with SLBB domain
MGMSATQMGCNSFFNSWLDPTQMGDFRREATLDIRTSLSIQDTPSGIPGASDPIPEDLVPIYEEYKYGPGDSLGIRIFELLASNTETGLQANIDDIGTITLPVLGQIRVSGMTRNEITEEIKTQLAQRQVIVTDPVVIVEPAVRRGLTFVLFGATPGPNVYPVPRPNTSLLEALNIAGGFPETATEVYIIRNPLSNAAQEASDSLQSKKKATATETLARANSHNRQPTFTFSDGVTGGSGGTPPSQQQKDELIEAAAGTRNPKSDLSLEQQAPGDASSQPRWVFTAEGEWIETDAPASRPDADSTPYNTIANDQDASTQPPVDEGAEPAIDWERLAGDDAVSRVIRVDAEALRNGDPRQNIIVRGGDKIRILAGEVGEYYMMGQVSRPGAYSLTGRRITLKTAIASAGNLAPLAWPNRCTVYRRYGDREEMHQVNLDAIFAGKENDLLLKNNDLILVGTHPAASFLAVIRNAFRLTYGFGFVYDRNFADIDSFSGQPNPAVTQASGFGSRFPNLFR